MMTNRCSAELSYRLEAHFSPRPLILIYLTTLIGQRTTAPSLC